MQTAQVIAGYSLGGADLLRRAMGKKKTEEMDQAARHLRRRRRGATASARRWPTRSSTPWRSSPATASTSRTPPPTRWSPTRPPGSSTITRRPSSRRPCRRKWPTPTRCSSSTRTPSTTASTSCRPTSTTAAVRFQPVDRKTIRYGLGAIKGTGESALGAILKARAEGGPFTDLFDFCRRVDKRVVNRRVIEALIRAGAFDASTTIATSCCPRSASRSKPPSRPSAMRIRAACSTCGGDGRGAATALRRSAALGRSASDCSTRSRRSASSSPATPTTSMRDELAAFVKRRLGQLEPQREPVLTGRRGASARAPR